MRNVWRIVAAAVALVNISLGQEPANDYKKGAGPYEAKLSHIRRRGERRERRVSELP